MKSEKNSNYRHGLAINGKTHPIYNAHKNMMARCYNQNHPKYHRYGLRGIKVCEDWKCVKNFKDWSLNNGWVKGLTLDRIDNEGDYTPENCQWLSLTANSSKRSGNKLDIKQVEEIRNKLFKGEKMKNLAEEYGVHKSTIWFIKEKITHANDSS